MSQPAWTLDAPRNYLFVTAREPLGAAAAVWSWADAPPDLCVTSPSWEAHDTATFACAGRFVRIVDEPLLARRSPGESVNDFSARYAEALRIVLAFDARAALVVCDQLPPDWPAPIYGDGDDLLRRAELIERRLRLA